MGAIYTVLITKVLQVILSVIFTSGIFIYEFNYLKIYIIPIIYAALNLVQFHFTKSYNLYLYLGQLVIFIGIFYFVFKNEILIVFKQFTGKTV